jgi:hypothetical protein
VPVGPEQLFNVASVGKQFTVEHLLNHTSGIANIFMDEAFRRYAFEDHTPQQLMAQSVAMPLLAPPGDGYAYSSANYTLLAMIIEQLTGEKVDAYLARQFFAPLGMTHTHAIRDTTLIKGLRPHTLAGQPYLQSNGDIHGSHAEVVFLPASKIFVSILNSEDALQTGLRPVAKRLATIAAGMPRHEVQPMTLSESALRQLAGTYRHGADSYIFQLKTGSTTRSIRCSKRSERRCAQASALRIRVRRLHSRCHWARSSLLRISSCISSSVCADCDCTRRCARPGSGSMVPKKATSSWCWISSVGKFSTSRSPTTSA